MRRAGRFSFLVGLFFWGCVDAPVYIGPSGGGGAGGATATTGTMATTTGSSSSSTGPGSGGGGGSNVAPTPVWCNFMGTANDEQLFDLRPAPNGTDIVAGGDFAGNLVLDPSLFAPGISDGWLARLDPDGGVQSVRQLGSDDVGSFGASVVASQDRLIGLGQYRGNAGGFSSDPNGSVDLVIFDFDGGVLLGAGSQAEDNISSGFVSGGVLFYLGDANTAGIDLGTGALSSPGFVAGRALDTNQATFAIPLGVGASQGSGHMVVALPDGTAWASVNLGGPGTTDVACAGQPLATTAENQLALLHLTGDGTCLAGRVFPSGIVEDTDLFIMDGKPGLSGSFTGSIDIDGIGITAGGSEPDAFVAFFNDELVVTDLVSYGGEGEERPNEVIVTPGGSLIIAGEFAGTTIIGDVVATSFDESYDIFVMKMSSAGEILWSKVFRGPGVQAASGLTMNGQGHLFLGGYATGALDCASPEPEYHGGYDMYLMRFDAGTL